MYMLDTNICIYTIKQRPLSVLQRFEKVGSDLLCISIVTYAELKYGVEKSSSKKLNASILKAFVERLLVFNWDKAAADEYAKIRRYLERKGSIIGSMDLMIAAHALSQECILVTNNSKEFCRVPNLKIEDWV